jgi:hypothetical protein
VKFIICFWKLCARNIIILECFEEVIIQDPDRQILASQAKSGDSQYSPSNIISENSTWSAAIR